MNWESVPTDLFSEFPVVTAAIAWGAESFSDLSAVLLLDGVARLDAVRLRRTAVVR
jgi:hypothetical protein